MKLLTTFLLLLSTLSAYAVDYPATWPRSLDDVEVSYTPNRMTIAWSLPDNKFYCASGTLTQVGGIVARLMRPFQNENFLSSNFLTRNQDRIIVRDLSDAGVIACNTLGARIAGVWIVDRFSDKLTRPVYAITNNFPSVKRKIGTIPFDSACGAKVAAYSARIKVYEWRRVTLPGGVGATVCRKR